MTVDIWSNRQEDIELILEQELDADDEITLYGTEITELSFKDSLVQDACFTDEDAAYYHVGIAYNLEGIDSTLSVVVAVEPETGEMQAYNPSEPL